MGSSTLQNNSPLNEADFRSETWQKIKAQLEQRLESCRKRNDSNALSVIDTAHLRGRITELKYLIDLEEGPSKQIDAIE